MPTTGYLNKKIKDLEVDVANKPNASDITSALAQKADASQLAAKANYVVLTQAAYDALVAADELETGTLYEITDSTEEPLSVEPIVVVNANASPTLGTLANNYEYRCTGSVTTAPTLTLAAIAAASTIFAATVIYTAPDNVAPVVTNNSGKTLKYQGSGVSGGTFTPVSASTYRMTFLWDGIFLNVYITGVA